MKCPNPTGPTYLVSCFKQTSWRLLELPKIPLPLSFALANVLAITMGSIVSVNVLWQWASMQLFNRSGLIVFVGYVLRCLGAEKLCSDVETHVFQKMEHTAKLNAGLTRLIHWKPIQLKFCIKIVFLGPDESTLLKCKKVIYYSTTRLPRPAPTKKVGGAEAAYDTGWMFNYILTIGL